MLRPTGRGTMQQDCGWNLSEGCGCKPLGWWKLRKDRWKSSDVSMFENNSQDSLTFHVGSWDGDRIFSNKNHGQKLESWRHLPILFSVEERVAISLAAGANLRDMCLGRFGGEEQGGAGHDTPARSCKILQDEVSFSKECPYTCKQLQADA